MKNTPLQCVTVLGKGGVGRTTVAIGVARALAARGNRVLLLELSGAQDVSRALGNPEAPYEPQCLEDGLDHACYRASTCLADFGATKLGIPSLLTQLFNARPVRSFLEAIPGLNELLQLGKMVHELGVGTKEVARYDTCVIDAPATGHGLTLLQAASTMRQLTRVGPFTELARPIEQLLQSPQALTIAVTTPEPLPIEESERLIAALDAMGQSPGAVVLNRVPTPLPPTAPTWERMATLEPMSTDAGWTHVGGHLWQTASRCHEARTLFAASGRPVVSVNESERPLTTLDAYGCVRDALDALVGGSDD